MAANPYAAYQQPAQPPAAKDDPYAAYQQPAPPAPGIVSRFSVALSESSPFSATTLDLSKPKTGIPVLDKSRTEQLQDFGRSVFPGLGPKTDPMPLRLLHGLPFYGPGLSRIASDVSEGKLPEAAGHAVGTLAVPTGIDAPPAGPAGVTGELPETIPTAPAPPGVLSKHVRYGARRVPIIPGFLNAEDVIDFAGGLRRNPARLPLPSPSGPEPLRGSPFSGTEPPPPPNPFASRFPERAPAGLAPSPPAESTAPFTVRPAPPSAPFGSVKPNPAPWERPAPAPLAAPVRPARSIAPINERPNTITSPETAPAVDVHPKAAENRAALGRKMGEELHRAGAPVEHIAELPDDDPFWKVLEDKVRPEGKATRSEPPSADTVQLAREHHQRLAGHSSTPARPMAPATSLTGRPLDIAKQLAEEMNRPLGPRWQPQRRLGE